MKRNILYSAGCCVLAVFAALCINTSCGHRGHSHAHEHETETSDHDHDGHDGDGHDADPHAHHHDGIVLSPEKARAAGVKVETARKGAFHGVIHTSGMVMAASCDETTVVATISGRIGHISHISEGMRVAGGTTLYTITSAGMQDASGDPVQRAKIDYEKARRDYERAESLVKDKIISEKDFLLAKSEYEAAQLTYHAVQRNRSAGGTVVAAPKAGFVKQNLVKEGDYVEAGQPLMVITQNQHLYLRAEVPERRWNELSQVKCAKFRTSYSDRLYDITDMGGKVQSYGRSSETGTAYVPIIFEFNNTGDVVPGSYAEIYLITSPRADVLTLPVAAITEEQGVYFVYVQTDEDEYRKQPVMLGMNDGERVEILSGVHVGDKVVTVGAIQVKLAAASNVIPAHNHNH